MKDFKITFRYIIFSIIVVFFTWVIHEFAHWSTSELLGHKSIMRLNATISVDKNTSNWHRILISASGPLITILQAIIAFLLLKRIWNKFIYLFLFTAFYMRLLASIMNIINPNDEGRISQYFELGLYTIPILVSLFLFYLVSQVSNRFQLPRSFHGWTTLLLVILTSILILADQFLKIRLL